MTQPTELIQLKRSWGQALLALVGAIGLFIFWILFIRSGNEVTGVSRDAFGSLSVNPYFFGTAIQELLVPLMLFLLVSRTPIFQRVMSGNLTQPDRSWMLLLLISIQLLYGAYQIGLIRGGGNITTSGLFVVVVAGLLGGWQIGVVVGAVVAFTHAYIDYAVWSGNETFVLNDFLLWYVLQSIEAMLAIWVGFVVGFVSEMQLRSYRFSLRRVLFVGIFVECVFVVAILFTNQDIGWYMERFIPSLVITALALVSVALMARSVQEEQFHREVESAQLELAEANLTLTETRLALTQAELRALHAQINPHFFFNSLNTIRYFIRTDPAVARDLLTNLSEVFQSALSAGEFVSLQEEIHHVEAYLALEKARLDERLQVIWTNLAKNLLELQIPTLILQPLVENAIIHGISPKTEGGTIHIVINQVGNNLLIQVGDDGLGFESENLSLTPLESNELSLASNYDDKRPSIGLRNVNERLRMLYGEAHCLHIESEPGEGTRVVLTIPLP